MKFAQEFLQISVLWPHLFLAYFQLFRQIWAPSLQLNGSKSVTLITLHFTSPSSHTRRSFSRACSHIRDVAWSSCCSFVIWDGSIYIHYFDKNERSSSCQLYFCIYKALILFWFNTQWRWCEAFRHMVNGRLLQSYMLLSIVSCFSLMLSGLYMPQVNYSTSKCQVK